MIVYFDTSALLAIILLETGSDVLAALWNTATRRVSSTLIYPEGRAALARAQRVGRLTARSHQRARAGFETRILEVHTVDPTIHLCVRAGDLAERHGLRGYDAVHLASALVAPGAVVATGDLALKRAAAAEGIPTSL